MKNKSRYLAGKDWFDIATKLGELTQELIWDKIKPDPRIATKWKHLELAYKVHQWIQGDDAVTTTSEAAPQTVES